MPAYRAQGHFRMGRVETPFTLEVLGKDEDGARERVLSTLGSRHRVDRRHIAITSLTALKPDEVTDHAVAHALEKGA